MQCRRTKLDTCLSAADSGIRLARRFAGDVLEQEVSEARRVVQMARTRDVRRDDELSGPDERLQSDRVVLEGPRETDPIGELREPVPPQRPDPAPAERLDESPEIEVRRQIRLEDCDAGFLGALAPRAQDLERPRGHAVPHVRAFDERVVREAMESSRELLRMDPESTPQALKRDLGRRILGEELEDLAVVLPQVERVRSNARFAALRHHRPRSRRPRRISLRPRESKGRKGTPTESRPSLHAANVPLRTTARPPIVIVAPLRLAPR